MKNLVRNLGVGQLIICLAMLVFSVSVSAKGRATVRVQVSDKINQAVDYDVAELRDITTGKVVKKSLTNEQGELVFRRVKPGKYVVAVTTPGFYSSESQMIFIDELSAEKIKKQLVVLDENFGNDVNVTSLPEVKKDSTRQVN